MPVDPITGEETPYNEGELQDLAGGGGGEIPPELLQAFGALNGPEDPAAVIAQIGQEIGAQADEAHAMIDEELQGMLDMLHQVLDQAAVGAATIGTPGIDTGIAGGAPFAAPPPAPAGDAGIDLQQMLASGQAPGPAAIPPEMAAEALDPRALGAQ